ncbi:hypothetical protein [Mangrovibacterium marinum]|uniref:hypothetical protein n=1 Tax=Mangrovibacterium marinum TaxID=1639118 RepID=UPI002A1893CA|nr:hypothetical protein [Mangrovibacterium marinum]
MGVKNSFEKDFQEAIQFFPKLKYRKSEKGKMWIVSGELDICDQVGDYWETFIIAIYLPTSYPYCTPRVKEISQLILRDDDWHINDEGLCCLNIEHRMLLIAKRGMNLTSFIREKVYPYFANQLFKKNEGQYAAGEYLHNFDGVAQFYREELNIASPVLAVEVLKGIISNKLPERNDPCFCGNGKYKQCHMASVEFLRSLPFSRLDEDLEEFSKLIC